MARREANMGLYYILLKIWIEVFGDSEFMVRLLSVTFAIGGVVMTYAIGVRLFNIRAGLTAACILAVNAYFLKHAQDARVYTLLLLLATSSIYLFIQAVEKQHYKYYIALGLINALVLYAHFLGFMLLIAQFTSLAFLPLERIQWKKILVCAILTASLASPLAVFILTQDADTLSWVKKPTLRSFYLLFIDFTGNGGKYLLLSYFVPCFLSLIIALRNLVCLKKSLLLWQYGLLFCWLFLPILSIFLVSILKQPLWVHRYMIYSLPALVLLTGVGLSFFKPKLLFVIATSLLIILSIYTILYIYYPTRETRMAGRDKFNHSEGKIR